MHKSCNISCASRPRAASISAWLLWLALALGSGLSGAQGPTICGDARDSLTAPRDYRTVKPTFLKDVERNHFTAPVQMLLRAESTQVGGVGRDISYTLHVIPNHPQALLAMMRLAEKEKVERPRGARFPVWCYFERALGFVPDDYNVRVLYGTYLARSRKEQDAREHLQRAAQQAPDDPNVQYNLGLAYFEIKDFDKSLEHARRAYALGFALPGLRRKLEAEGKWVE
jgi:hypothetical protein